MSSDNRKLECDYNTEDKLALLDDNDVGEIMKSKIFRNIDRHMFGTDGQEDGCWECYVKHEKFYFKYLESFEY